MGARPYRLRNVEGGGVGGEAWEGGKGQLACGLESDIPRGRWDAVAIETLPSPCQPFFSYIR